MKTWVLVFGVVLCSQAFSQETTSTLQVADVIAPSVSMPESQAVPSSAWKLTLGSENYTYEANQRDYDSAPIVSYNWVGVRYVPSKVWEFELRQQFQFATSREHLGARDTKLHSNSSLEMAEMVLRVAAKPKNVLGSNVSLFEMRYYAPTDRVAQENRELGRLRLDAWLEWAVNSKFTFAGWLSPRVQFNSDSNPNLTVGADAEYYQVKAAPYFIYNMNDHIAPYYAYNLVEKFSQAQRGNWEPDMANVGAHELGLNLSYGAFLINPSVISETNLENGDGSIFSNDSRAYSYENISYNLNVYAVF